ncbi:Terpene synthase family, metal binding domain [Micromonospora pallida]|uniref:Terpene synthase n=1 Tax=Micromonospora pallida TaxID=145854 RepID=A0A1C6RN40_9ACTN|nr:terpene synthase [Micromonospora pallida]SCL18597.1 Terpene synthase family, metal binding domain [Micromonospora pallida]
MRSFALFALREPPFPARCHPAVAQVARESAEWAERLGLTGSAERRRRLAGAAAADLAARACPEAPVDRLRLLTDLISWLFAVDDACDEDGLGDAPTRLAPTVAGLLDVLDLRGDPAPPALLGNTGPRGVALHDLCRRVRAHDRPAVLLAFTGQLREYLLALLWEAANREHGRVPGVAEYVRMRRRTGGVHPSFTLTDLAYDGPPPDERSDPALTDLEALAADLVCWCNDVFSYRKEHRSIGDGHTLGDGHNLVVAIAREEQQHEQAALLAAADLFNRALAAYTEQETALLRTADPATHRFVAARRGWIRATYDWSLTAARYA